MPTEFIVANEPVIRLVCFLGAATLLGIAETLMPRRARSVSRRVRWPNNLGLAAINTLIVRLIVPAGAVGIAVIAQARGWGLGAQTEVPEWLVVVLCIVVLDFVIFLQHVLLHAVPALWRLHRVHHADLDFDLTTGVRFHPLEILISLGVKFSVVALLGVPVVAVVLFEVLLNATSLFNHANLRLPLPVDRVLRWVLVTPDMHRVHHSVLPHETNRNFGFNLSCWDRLFGLYRAAPRAGHESMAIGIEQFRNPRELWLDRLITQPWRGGTGRYSMRATDSTPDS